MPLGMGKDFLIVVAENLVRGCNAAASLSAVPRGAPRRGVSGGEERDRGEDF